MAIGSDFVVNGVQINGVEYRPVNQVMVGPDVSAGDVKASDPGRVSKLPQPVVRGVECGGLTVTPEATGVLREYGFTGFVVAHDGDYVLRVTWVPSLDVDAGTLEISARTSVADLSRILAFVRHARVVGFGDGQDCVQQQMRAVMNVPQAAP